jgi:hypothetical protein
MPLLVPRHFFSLSTKVQLSDLPVARRAKYGMKPKVKKMQ